MDYQVIWENWAKFRSVISSIHDKREGIYHLNEIGHLNLTDEEEKNLSEPITKIREIGNQDRINKIASEMENIKSVVAKLAPYNFNLPIHSGSWCEGVGKPLSLLEKEVSKEVKKRRLKIRIKFFLFMFIAIFLIYIANHVI